MLDQKFPHSQIISALKMNICERNYAKFNHRAFRIDSRSQQWVNDFPHVNDQYGDFINKLVKYVDKHAPIKKLNKKQSLDYHAYK